MLFSKMLNYASVFRGQPSSGYHSDCNYEHCCDSASDLVPALQLSACEGS